MAKHKIADLSKFYLVTVPATTTYHVLYAHIPEIDQIQHVCHFDDNMLPWSITSHGRSMLKALSSKWAVDIKVTELSSIEALLLYPGMINLEYSTLMMEDLQLRYPYKYQKLHTENLTKKRNKQPNPAKLTD